MADESPAPDSRPRRVEGEPGEETGPSRPRYLTLIAGSLTLGQLLLIGFALGLVFLLGRPGPVPALAASLAGVLSLPAVILCCAALVQEPSARYSGMLKAALVLSLAIFALAGMALFGAASWLRGIY